LNSFYANLLLIMLFAFPVFSQENSSNIHTGNKDTVKSTTGTKAKPIIGTLDLFLTAPVVNGQDRDEFEISQKIMDKKNQFIQCYVNNLTKYDPLSFRIRFEITIKPSGEVQTVNVIMKGTKNQVMMNCLKAVFRQIIFSAVSGTKPTIVEQSLIFRVI
jgi:hypothetical protein